MNPENVAALVAIVLALVAVGGLGLQQQRVAALRSDITDERNRSEGLRDDVTDLERDLTTERAKNARLTSDLRHAEALALRESHWAEVIDKLAAIEQALKGNKP